MKVFITGASGYIGGAVAARLIAAGHEVSGLVRDPQKANQLRERGIVPVLGDLDDAGVLAEAARQSDTVVNAANADHAASAFAMLDALAGSGKAFIHTSGSSVVGDDARGMAASERVFDEDTPFVVEPLKAARHTLNQSILEAARRDVRAIVVCPALIYGRGSGMQPDSIQIPFLVQQALASGVVRVIGSGANRWSTVHIDDLADLYLAALERAPAAAFYFAENGESSFREMGQAIAARLGLDDVQAWPAQDAAKDWGPARANYTFGSNSRVRAKRARKELGWNPQHDSACDWILNDMGLEARTG